MNRASIRPRLFSRGNRTVARRSHIRVPELQFGHGSSAVETPIAPNRGIIISLLQFGHGSSAVETTCLPRVHAPPSTSLQFGHGSSAVETQPRLASLEPASLASIRPRLFSRGNCGRWGRGRAACGRLQFGHGSSAVETRRVSHPNHGHAGCFNSATALQPWKLPRSALSATRRQELQFGHGSSAVETVRTPAPAPTAAAGFNSATALQPWKPLGARPKQRGLRCFNSATALQPWKRVGDAAPGCPEPRASIRPRLFSRGNRAEAVGVRAERRASIRPRLFSRGNLMGGRGDNLSDMLQFGHGSSAVETRRV